MYQVGDNIFYPMHGAGKINAIEEIEIKGEKQLYYKINMLIGSMKVMIPMKNISKLNIRPVKDLAAVKKVAAMFKDHDPGERLPWKIRLKKNTDKVESGSLEASAEVIYDSYVMEQEDKLNSSERRLLNQAKEFVLSELKLVKGMDKEKAEQFLSSLKHVPVAISSPDFELVAK